MTRIDVFLLIYGWLLTVGAAAAIGWLYGGRPPAVREPVAAVPVDERSYEERVRALLTAPEWKGGDRSW